MFITLGHMVRVCSCQTWVLQPLSYIMSVHNKGARAQSIGMCVTHRVQVWHARYRVTHRVEVGGHASEQYKVGM